MSFVSQGLFLTLVDASAPVLEPLCEPNRVKRVLDERLGRKRCVIYGIAPQPRFGPPGHRADWRNLRVEVGEQPAAFDAWKNTRDLGVVLAKQPGALQLIRPLTATRPLFFTRRAGSFLVADDARWLIDESSAVDLRGLLCLMELGGLFAPFSPWREIELLAPGTALTLDADTLEATRAVLEFWENPRAGSERTLDQAEQDRKLCQTLDGTLLKSRSEADPVILFSGGVDSGVFAARAVALGWKDTKLVHCSMGKNDPETHHARAMADALRLSFSTVEYAPEEVLPLFDELLDCYSVPFSDYSILPTFLLSRHVAEQFSERSAALDGTAADASFGFFDGLDNWRRFYLLPDLVRGAVGRAYGLTRAWAEPGRLDAVLRKFKRSAGWPGFAANLIVHPMREVGFFPPRGVTAEVLSQISSYYRDVLPDDADVAFCVLDILHQCAGVLAQKDRSVFDASPVALEFPFLEPEMIRLALEHARFWPGTKTKKIGLKRLLAERVPPAMVYRNKSGFVIPQQRTFAHRELLGRFDAVLDDRAHPLADWLNRDVLARIRRALVAEKRLALYTYSFVWALIFSHGWLTRAASRSRAILAARRSAGPTHELQN